ncbi:oligosaccharide flippase family protein [Novosphingobium sp. RD2P27]|uniref:Oligosaccharide flippase family protein n=1 Tax=Novosphingobium kalidii TaxID=3230299 RepID=A0ABV2D1H6_9SPHN
MSQSSLLSKALTTGGLIGLSYGLRFGSNLILARLLAPEIFGVIVIAHSVRLGVELLTDVGVEQNIVQNPRGLDERFFNTAWTVQILRGILLTALFLATAPWLADFFRIELAVLVAVSFTPLIIGCASTAIFALAKGLEVRRRNVFELKVEGINVAVAVLVAAIWPTVWAQIAALLVSMLGRTLLSYRLPHPPHRLLLDREALRQILSFGKWIMVSSLLMYASTNLDRLYLGRVASLEILGVFGIAKGLADLPPRVARRLSYQIVFPFMAAQSEGREPRQLDELRATRWKFVLLAAAGLGAASAWSDWLVRLLYDPRYAAAGWMLAVLLVSAFVSVLSNLNEAKLLGIGRPAFNSYANVARLVVLAVAMPSGYAFYGVGGVVLAVLAGELTLYLGIAVGQHLTDTTFRRQDAAAALLFALIIASVIVVRTQLDLGVPFAGLFANEGASSP